MSECVSHAFIHELCFSQVDLSGQKKIASAGHTHSHRPRHCRHARDFRHLDLRHLHFGHFWHSGNSSTTLPCKKKCHKSQSTSRRKCNKAAGATLQSKRTHRDRRGVNMQATTLPCKTRTQGLATKCQNASHSIKFIMSKHASQIKQGGYIY